MHRTKHRYKCINRLYPKKHFPVSGSHPPLVNAGLSCHCSTSLSPEITLQSKHSSIFVPWHAVNHEVHGRGPHPGSPSNIDLINNDVHIRAAAGAGLPAANDTRQMPWPRTHTTSSSERVLKKTRGGSASSHSFFVPVYSQTFHKTPDCRYY